MITDLPPSPGTHERRPADRATTHAVPAALLDRTILLVCTNADLAGAPVHVRELAGALSERGLRLRVLFGEDGPVAGDLRARGIRCDVIPGMRSDMRFWRDIGSIASLRKILSEVDAPLVHAHSAKAGMVARIACRTDRIPVVYTVHGWGFGPGRPKLRSMIVQTIERSLVRATSRYIAVSEVDGASGSRDLGIPVHKLEVIHNGVADTTLLADPERADAVVMVARHGFPKDYATLFRAVAGLDCELWCVGGGTDTLEFKHTASSILGDEMSKVRFFGSRTDIPEILSQAAVFVLSSGFEGLPISVIEAMRAGLPIVASDVGGMRELVQPGINGSLFPPGDAACLARALERLLGDPRLRREWGRAARATYSSGFRLESTVAATLGAYTEALAGAGVLEGRGAAVAKIVRNHR
jgi:glycosyltransferase involved in cell wall biosynthesis